MKHEIIRFEECSLFNSSHCYRDGYDRVFCSCGWKSIPVKGKDRIDIHSAHAERAERQEKS